MSYFTRFHVRLQVKLGLTGVKMIIFDVCQSDSSPTRTLQIIRSEFGPISDRKFVMNRYSELNCCLQGSDKTEKIWQLSIGQSNLATPLRLQNSVNFLVEFDDSIYFNSKILPLAGLIIGHRATVTLTNVKKLSFWQLSDFFLCCNVMRSRGL